jgi:hypothetical protein
LHETIVAKTLPRFAERLKKESLVSDYNRDSLHVKIKHFNETHMFNVKPDLVLVLPDKAKFLIEIVNPRDPKRLLGEIVYLQILGSRRLIDAGIIFLLPLGPEHSTAPMKGLRLSFTSIATGMEQIISTKIPCDVASWSTTEENNYANLRGSINHRPKFHL